MSFFKTELVGEGVYNDQKKRREASYYLHLSFKQITGVREQSSTERKLVLSGVGWGLHRK